MTAAVDQFTQIERELLHDRFADFERGVLQDNIILCDAKSGILLAFAGAMVVFCIDAFVSPREAHGGPHWAGGGASALLLLSAAAFLGSCHYALITVLPRFKRGTEDHIFWESAVYRLQVEDYVQHMLAVRVEQEHKEKLRHLHLLAGICRNKYSHFLRSIRFAQAGFIILILAELARMLG